MGKDYNTWKLIYKRLNMVKNVELRSIKSTRKGTKDTFREIANIIVNIWYLVVINFEIILYNYFAPMCCVII